MDKEEDELKLKVAQLEEYFSSFFGQKVKVVSVGDLTEASSEDELKGFGYGSPLLVEIEVGEERRKVVIHTMKPSNFGHEYFWDRASSNLLAYSTFNKLPRHVRAIDVGTFTQSGNPLSLGEATEFFIVDEYAEGTEYFHDLERIKKDSLMADLDIKRAKALSRYLARIHKVKKDAPHLYTRRIRELVGHGECIMGLVDSYPSGWGFIEANFFEELEKKCVQWRWKLRGRENRLCQVHGDFHPWNVLFKDELDFLVLDRSRGEWGEPADDLTAMSINYLFYSLQAYGELKGTFKTLFETFMELYLEETQDSEILEVCPPFYAWRGLVIASPIWYPNLEPKVRRKIFNFIKSVLEVDKFELNQVNSYLEGSS